MRLNVYRDSVYLFGSIPMLCRAGPPRLRCQSVIWIPPDATELKAVIATNQSLYEASSPSIEVASPTATDATDAIRVNAVLEQIRLHYYRSSDANWAAIYKKLTAVPTAPRDIDPLPPPLTEYVRSMLPGNEHTMILPTTATSVSPRTTKLPTCDVSDEIGVLTLPGILVLSG